MRVPTLRDDRVCLRPVLPADRLARRQHGFHAEIERGFASLRATGPMSEADADAWYARAADAADDPTQAEWMIEADGNLAGTVRLHHIREVDATSRFAIGLLHPDLLGRGLGSAATRLVLQHAFGPLALHRVDLRVLAFNDGAITMYRRCGFVEEGRERETCRMGQAWFDDVIMGILDREFQEGATSHRS